MTIAALIPLVFPARKVGSSPPPRILSCPRVPAVAAKDRRVFDLDNLYVAGSSVFPASGYINPTLTLVALAVRLADHLKQA